MCWVHNHAFPVVYGFKFKMVLKSMEDWQPFITEREREIVCVCLCERVCVCVCEKESECACVLFWNSSVLHFFIHRTVMEPGKKVIRFHPALDILLLREVISINPDSRQTWDLAHRNINQALKQDCCVMLRTCRDRLKTLTDAHRRGEMESLRA